jgi:hypothetical protein
VLNTCIVFLVAAAVYLAGALVSDKYSIRWGLMLPMACVTVVGYVLLCASHNNSVKLFACFLCGAGIYICVGLHFTWIGRELTPMQIPLQVELTVIHATVSQRTPLGSGSVQLQSVCNRPWVIPEECEFKTATPRPRVDGSPQAPCPDSVLPVKSTVQPIALGTFWVMLSLSDAWRLHAL